MNNLRSSQPADKPENKIFVTLFGACQSPSSNTLKRKFQNSMGMLLIGLSCYKGSCTTISEDKFTVTVKILRWDCQKLRKAGDSIDRPICAKKNIDDIQEEPGKYWKCLEFLSIKDIFWRDGSSCNGKMTLCSSGSTRLFEWEYFSNRDGKKKKDVLQQNLNLQRSIQLVAVSVLTNNGMIGAS